MKKLKIYIDTSFIGYLHQPTMPKEQEDTRELLDLIKQGKYSAYISDVVVEELMKTGNAEVKSILLNYLAEIDYTMIETSDEARDIAETIKSLGILTEKSHDDCLHIGNAMSNNCDVLVSWNFKHLVNIDTIQGVRAISDLKNYKTLNIVQPTMLIQGGEK